MTELSYMVCVGGHEQRVLGPHPDAGWVFAGSYPTGFGGYKSIRKVGSDAAVMANSFAKALESIGVEVGYSYSDGVRNYWVRKP